MRDCRTRGETPLHRAAAFGSAATIDLLLGAGAARDARDAAGDTPLSWASWHLRPADVIRRLCHGGMALHPEARWSGDHGAGWSGLDANLAGEPHP
ncbi:MAG: ankyrin repeat domain-containing protein [Alphaproteobacteria bacterium]